MEKKEKKKKEKKGVKESQLQMRALHYDFHVT